MLVKIKQTKPLIHAITNPISINQCANSILALGARPIMAEHPKEVREITKTANALLINLGNITDVRIKSIKISLKCAKKNNIPAVLDLVGIACSDLRKRFAKRLIKKYSPAVIKGNYSEIYALYDKSYKSSGVDAEDVLNENSVLNAAKKLAKITNAIVLATGKKDIISNGDKTICVLNGCGELTSVTGTGCMLGAVCACFISQKSDINAVAWSCAFFGICGEMAKNVQGSGTFMVNLTDNLSKLKDSDLKEKKRYEEI